MRLNIASNRLSDGTWVSNIVANADTGSVGRPVSGAGQRSKTVPAGKASQDGVVRAKLTKLLSDPALTKSSLPWCTCHREVS